MNTVFWLLAIQGLIGVFDTLYYHEYRARLPARETAKPELRLHALRDFVYAVIFGTLPWVTWQGSLVAVLALLLSFEIVVTMTDFVVEIKVRKPLGDVYAGERVTHAVMAIVYGAMLSFLCPELLRWWSLPTGFATAACDSQVIRWILSLMAVGVFSSGVRDLYAASGGRFGGWPWKTVSNEQGVGTGIDSRT